MGAQKGKLFIIWRSGMGFFGVGADAPITPWGPPRRTPAQPAPGPATPRHAERSDARCPSDPRPADRRRNARRAQLSRPGDARPAYHVHRSPGQIAWPQRTPAPRLCPQEGQTGGRPPQTRTRSGALCPQIARRWGMIARKDRPADNARPGSPQTPTEPQKRGTGPQRRPPGQACPRTPTDAPYNHRIARRPCTVSKERPP